MHIAYDQRVTSHVLLDGICRVNDRQVLLKYGQVVVVSAAIEPDAFHLVFQRRQHGREFTRLLVGGDIDKVRLVVAAASTVAHTLDAVGGTLHGDVGGTEMSVAMFIDDVVKRTLALFAEAQLNGGLAQAVLTAVEAQRSVLVRVAAVNTSGDVHQGRVDEVDGLCTLEVMLAAVHRERGEAVSVQIAFYQVFADGHLYLVFTVGIAAHTLFRLQQAAVNHKLYAVNGDVGVQVGDFTPYRERRHIGEVVAVECQVAVADEAVAREGIKLMDALRRHQGIGRTAAHKGDAANDELAVGIGDGIACQLFVGRNNRRRLDVCTHGGVTTVGQIIGIGSVENTSVLPLVHRPVEQQALLTTV